MILLTNRRVFYSMLHALKRLGNRLDIGGHFALADAIDGILRSASTDLSLMSDTDLQ